MSAKLKIHQGHRFGRLTVIREVPSTPRRFLVQCKCGTRKLLYLSNLRSGDSVSCGCYRKEAGRTHGHSKHPLYKTWLDMKSRCYDKDHARYKDYGGRGIRMCKLWYKNLDAFIRWGIANGWKKGLQIDRRDNDKGYKPSNCRFVTGDVNVVNRRNTIWASYKGKRLPFSVIYKKYGNKNVKYVTALERFKVGRSVAEAIGI